jgi:hypothetical protein
MEEVTSYVLSISVGFFLGCMILIIVAPWFFNAIEKYLNWVDDKWK